MVGTVTSRGNCDWKFKWLKDNYYGMVLFENIYKKQNKTKMSS